jgi:hypothetical protein
MTEVPIDPPAPLSPDAVRWRELLAQLSVDRLITIFCDQVLRIPGYDTGVLSREEIHRTGTASFEALIRAVEFADDSAQGSAERLAIATEVGLTRAQAGIPIESLMTAIRMDFSILWDELIAMADSSDSAVLVRHTSRVWRIVDSYASQTQAAYMAERQRMHNEASSMTQDHVATIFTEAAPTPELLHFIAGKLGIPPVAVMSVAAALGEQAQHLRRVVAATALFGGQIFSHPLGGGLIAIWVNDDRAGSALRRAAEQIRDLPCGLVETVDGIAGLRGQARIAQDLAGLLTREDRHALTLAAGWERLARLRLEGSGVPMASDIDTALKVCGRLERDRLIEAARAYLATGSVAQTSSLLFCHRNTTMNRLQRFTQLTGIDVTVPRQAARLVVAWA